MKNNLFEIDKRLSDVKEVKETKSYEEVNALVKKGWILICIYPSEETFKYSLGRVN